MLITILSGRLTKDVELKKAKSGDKETVVGNFTLAVDDGYGEHKHTNFFPCSVFGKQAETMEKCVKKGTKIIMNCKPHQSSYKDNSGKNYSYVNFIVQSFEFAEGKNAKTEEQSQEQADQTQQTAQAAPKKEESFMNIPDELGDELPFQ